MTKSCTTNNKDDPRYGVTLLILLLLDDEEEDEVRKEAAEYINSVMDIIGNDLQQALYKNPPPSGCDLKGAIKICKECSYNKILVLLDDLYQRMLTAQRIVNEMVLGCI